MKKLLTLLLTLVATLTLTACGKEDNEEFVHNVPKEGAINIQELPYSDYLSLSNPVVTIKVKDIGEIKLQLFPDQAPVAVDNFIQYIQDGAYDGNEFHRVINNFMIQAGKIEEPACDILGEFSNNDVPNPVNHYRGILSMARLNGENNSGSSQWFLVEETSPHLDGLYASFGGMISGFTVLSYIAELAPEGSEVTLVPIVIETITVDLKGYVPNDRVCYSAE